MKKETNKKTAYEVLESLETSKSAKDKFAYQAITSKLGWPSDSDTAKVAIDLELLVEMIGNAYSHNNS